MDSRHCEGGLVRTARGTLRSTPLANDVVVVEGHFRSVVGIHEDDRRRIAPGLQLATDHFEGVRYGDRVTAGIAAGVREDAYQTQDLRFESGLLADFPHDRLHGRLAEFDEAARQRGHAAERIVSTSDRDELPVEQDEAIDRDGGMPPFRHSFTRGTAFGWPDPSPTGPSPPIRRLRSARRPSPGPSSRLGQSLGPRPPCRRPPRARPRPSSNRFPRLRRYA